MAPRPLPFVVATVAIVSVVAFAGLVAAASHPAVPAGFLPEGMTSAPSGLRDSQTTMLPMRDGTKLHTVVDFPLNKPKTNLTVVMDRSPYGMYALEMISDIYTIWGFAAVRQDMRGTQQSDGTFSIWHSAANDSYDTMQWISQQPWSNGEVYTVGASADGLASFEMLRDSPPWLKKQFIIFASGVGYPIAFPGGAFRQALDVLWLNSTVPSQGTELIHTLEEHEAHDSWWAPLSGVGEWQKVKWPTVMFAGWYIFLDGNLIGFEAFQKQSDPSVRGQHKIVIDPLGHCQAGSKYFKNNLIFGRVPLPIFLSTDLFKGIQTHPDIKAVTFYVMGPTDAWARGNYWTTLDDFPVPTYTNYYLGSAGPGTLGTTAPTATGDVSYLYDPSNPVPTIGGNNLKLHCGPLDQSPVENRTDVIKFETGPLDADLWVTGELQVTLFVSTNATDTDFTAKLTDVYPTGESRLIQDGIKRMRWRDNTLKPEPVVPGQVYKITLNLWNTSYVFNKGHSLRVSISSSNYPRFSPNRNNGEPLLTAGPLLVAENTLHIDASHAPFVRLPVVTPADLPQHSVFWATKGGDEAKAQADEARWLVEYLDEATGGLNYNGQSKDEYLASL